MKMKNLVLLLMISFLLVADTCLGQTGKFSIASPPQLMPSDLGSGETPLPELRGDAAIDTLKRSGQYDSLVEAISSARADENPADDLFTQQAKLNNPEPAGSDYFGYSVAISGDTAIVGAIFDDGTFMDQGSAYVFVRSGTVWSQQAKLTALDAAAGDQFGISVAISGDTAIVGARFDDAPSQDQGSAYVFVRSGTAWSQQAKLTASDAEANDRFGYSVAISGDTAIVGANIDTGTFLYQGSAYVFVRSGTVWSQQAKLTASDAAAFDNFGNSVAISGDTAIVGADYDDGTFTDQGSAYVFVRSGAVWTQQPKLTASDAEAYDRFGFSVAISGDTAIVGARFDDGTFTDQGSAYVFVRIGAVWSQQAKLTASDAAEGDLFGISVAISGDTAIVGVTHDDHVDGTFYNQGSAYVFVRSGTAWSQQAKLTASDAGTQEDQFGHGVAISGNTAIVGAPLDSSGTIGLHGSAYVFQNLTPTAASVSVSGRVSTSNGRGISTVRVTITDVASGETQTALTNAFGYYRFERIPAGQSYILEAAHKRYQFAPQVVTVVDEITNADLTALP